MIRKLFWDFVFCKKTMRLLEEMLQDQVKRQDILSRRLDSINNRLNKLQGLEPVDYEAIERGQDA
jgi:hypothetical protein